MKTQTGLPNEDFTEAIPPFHQYDGLVSGNSISEGEYRLLWAILKDAIRIYVANCSCSSAVQSRRFKEVRDWFEPAHTEAPTLFDFRSVCDLLRIDSDRVLNALKSIAFHSLALKRLWVLPNARPQKLAA
jgi:hypothetical protein